MTSKKGGSRVDANHALIGEALRKMGWYVTDTHAVARLCHLPGYPDYECVLRRRPAVCVKVEVKQPGEKLNDKEVAWHAAYPGFKEVVTTVEECQAMTHKYTYLELDMASCLRYAFRHSLDGPLPALYYAPTLTPDSAPPILAPVPADVSKTEDRDTCTTSEPSTRPPN
jgi:hypothetical protein